MSALAYRVGTFHTAGLEAKWGKTRMRAPVIFVRDPNAKLPHQRETWWECSAVMWTEMQEHGIKEGFNNATLVGDIFSI